MFRTPIHRHLLTIVTTALLSGCIAGTAPKRPANASSDSPGPQYFTLRCSADSDRNQHHLEDDLSFDLSRGTAGGVYLFRESAWLSLVRVTDEWIFIRDDRQGTWKINRVTGAEWISDNIDDAAIVSTWSESCQRIKYRAPIPQF